MGINVKGNKNFKWRRQYTPQDYQNRFRNSLKKKIELMKLRYEKCMKSRVFTDPMRKIRDMSVLLDSYVQRLEKKIKNCLCQSRSMLP